MSIRVLLVDDHPIVRQGLHRLLEIEPDFEVVGEAGDGLEALAMVNKLQPDVLILDLMMPGLNGLEVTRQVLERRPGIRVVVLSMHQDEAYVLQALRCGAKGYVLKDSSPRELATAIRLVSNGDSYFSEAINRKLVNAMLTRLEDRAQVPDSEPEPVLKASGSEHAAAHHGLEAQKRANPAGAGGSTIDSYELLSRRERVVLQLIAEGNTNAEVARRLEISPRTAEAHRASIMHKLNLSNVTELMRYAIKRGIIKLDS